MFQKVIASQVKSERNLLVSWQWEIGQIGQIGQIASTSLEKKLCKKRVALFVYWLDGNPHRGMWI